MLSGKKYAAWHVILKMQNQKAPRSKLGENITFQVAYIQHWTGTKTIENPTV